MIKNNLEKYFGVSGYPPPLFFGRESRGNIKIYPLYPAP
jgi:hypothetical protein